MPPDPVYVSVVERRPAKPSRLPWLTAAALTILVPVLVLSLSHFFVASHLFFEQGVIILLFFAWVTGAQALFAAHKMTHSNPWQVMGGILASFVLVVVGYTLISHYFGNFLYPEHGASARLFASASIGVLSYDVLVIVLALLFVGGWALTFFADAQDWGQRIGQRWHGTYVALYALLTRELYLNDLYVRMTQLLLAGSRRLNVWLRWS